MDVGHVISTPNCHSFSCRQVRLPLEPYSEILPKRLGCVTQSKAKLYCFEIAIDSPLPFKAKRKVSCSVLWNKAILSSLTQRLRFPSVHPRPSRATFPALTKITVEDLDGGNGHGLGHKLNGIPPTTLTWSASLALPTRNV